MRIWAKGIGANPSQRIRVMSALPPKADIGRAGRDVRFVPTADSCTAAIKSHIQRRTLAT